MSIGLGYRPGAYSPVPAWRRWWPLARQEFFTLFGSKWGVAMFCALLIPVAVRLFVLMILYGVVNFGAGFRGDMLSRSQALAQWDPMRPDFYVEAVVATFPGLPILVLLTAWATAGAVARDRATNALELFWTRGISPWGYLLGKWIGSLSLVGLVFVAGPCFLWLMAGLFADDWTQVTGTLGFILPALGGLLLVSAIWTASCVLLSVLCSTSNQAIVAWCLLVLGSAAVANVMAIVFHEPAIRSWMSVWDAGGVVARACAGVATRGAPVVPAISFLCGLLIVQCVLATRRLALREAIG